MRVCLEATSVGLFVVVFALASHSRRQFCKGLTMPNEKYWRRLARSLLTAGTRLSEAIFGGHTSPYVTQIVH